VAGEINAGSHITSNSGYFVGVGTHVVVGNAEGSGTIYLRPNGYASNTNATTVDGSGNMHVQGAMSVDNNISGYDLTASRAGPTGVIYLGNSGNSYLYFNGSSYSLPSYPLGVGGSVSATSFLVHGNANYISMQDNDQGQTRHIHHNSGFIGFLNSGGGWCMRMNDAGQLWTSQLGDLNTRIETRGEAWANHAINSVNVAGTIAAFSAAGIGAYSFLCRDGGGGAIAVNQMAAGGSLAWTNVASSLNGRPGGTWRCCGFVSSGSTSTGATTLWLRAA
jgi:hypothetical protein